MAATAFDTLDAARRLKAAGIEVEHAEAIVEIMGQSVNQLVTREHFSKELGLTREHFDSKLQRTREHLDSKLQRTREHLDAVQVELNARIDTSFAKLGGRIDALEANMSRMLLVSLGVMIAAIALATTILGMVLNRGGGA
ncbi:MAG: hypothetical protein F4053_03675 [Proteobacteria bacterium]|nr:hypothetical protein [Pseudomonadota bacterium]MYJ94705.1 hypothetical protein [Pseudomonadota bacterium]